MQNSIPVIIGTVTIWGIVINHHYVLLITCLVVMITCAVIMIKIIRNCNKRNKRNDAINQRRRERHANSVNSGTQH